MLSADSRQLLRTLLNYPDGRAHLRPTAWLDGLRGVAAFEVLLYHWHLQFLGYDHNPAYGSRPDTMQWWRLPFIRNFYVSGHAMVNVFFLISGFVLTQRSLTLIRSQQYEKLYPSISSAIFRRGIRIYLPSVAVTFCGMLLAFYGIKGMPMAPRQEHMYLQIWDWLYACVQFAQPFHDYNNELDILHRYEHVMWTLPLEFYGSIVCYLTVMAVARVTHPVKRNAVVLLVTWFAVIKANWWSANFLIGMLHADFMIWQGTTEKSFTTGFAAKCFWGVLFIWACYVAGLPDAHYDDYRLPGFDWYYDHVPVAWRSIEEGGRFWWMISGVTMTVSISQIPLLKRVFETRFCQYLGRISFMLYLVHSYVFEMVGRSWKNGLTNMVAKDVYFEELKTTVKVASGLGMYVVYFGFWIVMIPTVCIIAGQVTKYIDDPSIKFAKWLEGSAIEDNRDKETPSIPL